MSQPLCWSARMGYKATINSNEKESTEVNVQALSFSLNGLQFGGVFSDELKLCHTNPIKMQNS